MPVIRDLPLLAILPVDKLLLHERHDEQRSPHLLASLRDTEILRNPPIVAPLHDRTGRYMVLDGAHRTLAMQTLGLPHILAQVVEPDDPGLKLLPWNHVIWEIQPDELIHRLRNIPFIFLEQCDEYTAQQEMTNRMALAQISLPDGSIFLTRTPTQDLLTRVMFLNTVVDRYKDIAKLDRTKIQAIDALKNLYPRLTGLIRLPVFLIEEVLYLAGVGQMLPTGSTRFIISPRALHVNYPLAELEADQSLEEKNAKLNKWLQNRLAQKGVRYYGEATFLFDE